ncbi:MAG: hypothetical protein GXY52_09050 [Chloroflexi bacterium]|nr:hypothetical protein [Chloroflexota bacterium]
MPLHTYLAKFERIARPERDERIAARFRAVFEGEPLEQLPFVWSDLPPLADADWPAPAYNDSFEDRELMLLEQLRAGYLHYQTGDDYPVTIRANYGTVILPSIFGADWQLTESSMPWAHHLPNRDAIRALLDRGVPDVRAGLGERCLDTTQYYREILVHYPALSQITQIYHPDLQGPFDVAHLLWGPDIFLGFYDCPEMVHALLDLVTETYIAWLRAWKKAAGNGNDWTVHWNLWQRGGTMLRDDSAVMLSTAQYREFVQPYDQRVLDAFGGCIHFCGCGDQFIADMVTSRNLYGINMSQPELNNMPRLLDLCRQHKLVFLNLDEAYTPADATTGITLLRSWRASQG